MPVYLLSMRNVCEHCCNEGCIQLTNSDIKQPVIQFEIQTNVEILNNRILLYIRSE